MHYLPIFLRKLFESEQESWDPKRSELCFSRTKPEEILVEVRNGTDVQIVHQIEVQRRKTNRTAEQLVPSEVSLRTAEAEKIFYELHAVKLMIRGIGEIFSLAYSQTLNVCVHQISYSEFGEKNLWLQVDRFW